VAPRLACAVLRVRAVTRLKQGPLRPPSVSQTQFLLSYLSGDLFGYILGPDLRVSPGAKQRLSFPPPR
jgi:hypothetical protein